MSTNIDLQKIAEELEFDLEDVKMLISIFLESVTKLMLNLKEAIANHNFESIHQNAHAIKGSAANLNLVDISHTAKEIELASREKSTIDYMEYYKTLEKLIHEIK